MSRFVCFLYSFKAAVNIVSKFVVGVELEGTLDIILVEDPSLMLRENNVANRKLY